MPEPLLTSVLQVRGLRFAYPDQAPLFVDWCADVLVGVTLLQGDTGSGKTTLLRLLAGELLGGGNMTLHGRRFGEDPAAYRQGVCWFNPRDEAFDALTPAGLMAAQRDLHPGLDEAAWQRHLVGFDLAPHLAKPLYALSTGSRRKAGLAVALSVGCALTLLDEAAAGLDAASMTYLTRALADAAGHSQRALLLVSSQGLGAVPRAGTIQLPGSPSDS
jgi:ABC-2 type transport system ATP-binding protein